jgi:hypothetical protein
MAMGDFGTPRSPIDSSFKQKKSAKKLYEWHHNQKDLTDVYRVPSCKSTINILCPCNCLYNKSNFMLQSKSYQMQENWNNPLNTFRPQCNETRTQKQKKWQKILKQLETESHIPPDKWVIKEIREENKMSLESNWKWRHNLQKLVGYRKGSIKEKVYSHECIY